MCISPYHLISDRFWIGSFLAFQCKMLRIRMTDVVMPGTHEMISHEDLMKLFTLPATSQFLQNLGSLCVFPIQMMRNTVFPPI